MQHILKLGLAVLPALIPSIINAETADLIILKGNVDTPKTIALKDYNRITFNDDCISLSSSKNSSIEQIDLLYSLYYHIEFGNGEIGVVPGIFVDSQLFSYSEQNRCLILSRVDNYEDYAVGVFSVSGAMLVSMIINCDGVCDVSNLSSGIYIAIASDGKSKFTTKFIIK